MRNKHVHACAVDENREMIRFDLLYAVDIAVGYVQRNLPWPRLCFGGKGT